VSGVEARNGSDEVRYLAHHFLSFWFAICVEGLAAARRSLYLTATRELGLRVASPDGC
jgi:hypothetical protein